MNVLAEPFWIQKRGSPPEEYEDAARPFERCEYEEMDVRVAVADGATESVFAKRWAEQLVCAVCDSDQSPSTLSAAVSRLRDNWREWIAGKTLPWYAEEKARQGAFAAIIALELSSDNTSATQQGNWQAVAVGDSCLFHVRGEEVIVRFPIVNVESFNNRPLLLGSLGAKEEILNEKYACGTWISGDLLYLITHALACWFLNHIDEGGRPSDIQGHISSSEVEPFRAWIESLRDQGLLRNDDCTMIRVSIQ